MEEFFENINNRFLHTVSFLQAGTRRNFLVPAGKLNGVFKALFASVERSFGAAVRSLNLSYFMRKPAK